jgi:proliferating cell nuclear antigen
MSESAIAGESDDAELSFDAPETAAVSIVTNGDPARSLVCVVRSLVDEAKLRFDADGLSLAAIDPPNVGLLDVEVPAGAWSGYECASEQVVGMPLSFARKRSGNGDPVRIDFFDAGDRHRCRVAVIRPDQNVRRVSEFYTIDPDSVREEPEIPDLALEHHATPDLDAFTDALAEIVHDYGWFSRDGQTFLFGTQPTPNPELSDDPDDAGEMVDLYEFPGTAWGEGECSGSLFSVDYLDKTIPALDRAKCDHVTLQYGDQIPAKIRGEWTDWGFTVEYMVAPRMERDSDE